MASFVTFQEPGIIIDRQVQVKIQRFSGIKESAKKVIPLAFMVMDRRMKSAYYLYYPKCKKAVTRFHPAGMMTYEQVMVFFAHSEEGCGKPQEISYSTYSEIKKQQLQERLSREAKERRDLMPTLPEEKKQISNTAIIAGVILVIAAGSFLLKKEKVKERA